MQQSTIQFVKANPLQSMNALERAIAMPHEFTAQRFPSFPALERTATIGFNVPTTLGFPAAATTCGGILFRQASYPLWIERSLSRFVTAYTFSAADRDAGTTPVGGQGTTFFPLDGRPSETTVVDRLASTTAIGVSGAVTPPWTYPILGTHRDNLFTFIPKGAYYAYIVSTMARDAATDLFAVVGGEQWIEPNAVVGWETKELTLTGNNLSSNVTAMTQATANTWLRPTSVSFTSPTGSTQTVKECFVTVLVSSGNGTFTPSSVTAGTYVNPATAATVLTPLAPPPEFHVTERPWLDCRVTAAALLLTNVTKVMDKEGTVLAGRLANRSDACWSFSEAVLAGLHPAEKALLPLETGFYTYAPPSTDLATFFDYTAPVGGINSYVRVPAFNLDNTALANCFILTDSDTATGSTFAVNLDWHMEFRNNSTLFPIGMSSITLEAFHQACLNLAAHGFFFSNDKHKAMISKIVSAGRKLLPLVGGMVPGPTGVVLKTAASMADRMLSKRLNTTPPTTSAKASGMVPKSSRPAKRSKGAPNKKQSKKTSGKR